MKQVLPAFFALCVFTGIHAQSGFSFTAAQTLTTETNQRGLIYSDINGDGTGDLVTGSAYNSFVYIFSGSSSGPFTTATGAPLANNNGPISMAPADYNGDGKKDIAVTNYNNNDLSVFLASGSGIYTAAPNVITGYQPYCVAAADFNMDGKMDLVSTCANDNNLFLLTGDGSGGFSVTMPVAAAAAGLLYHVSTGNFNNDVFPDIAFISGGANRLYVYLGNGAGGFTAATGSPFITGTQPRTITVGDLNNDGHSDLIVPNALSNNINIFLGSASGAFSAAPGSPIATGAYPYQAVVGDFNLNGTQDIIVSCGSSNYLSVLSGAGTGTFSTATPLALSGNDPQAICTGDFNGDGKGDLAVSYWQSNNVNIFMNTNTVCVLSTGFNSTTSPGGQVSFNSTSSGTVSGSSFSWNFGDGGAGSGATPSHTFGSGTYTVTLLVNNMAASSCTASVTHVINVCALSPVFNYTTGSGGLVMFNGVSSGTASGAAYSWNFGDGTTDSSTNPSHSFGTGIYTVTLQVNNLIPAGCTASATHVINICDVSTAYTYTTGSGGQVAFNGVSSGTTSGATYSWDFGDGTTGNGADPAHTFGTGSHVVTLQVNNVIPTGCTASVAHIITICNISPAFTYTAGANGQILFNTISSGTTSGTLYSWNFGDGTTGSGASPSHTYTAGTYTVAFTVNDPGSPDCTGSVTQVITIMEQVTGLKKNADAVMFQVYPNPSRSAVYVTMSQVYENTRFVLYSALGQQLMNEALETPGSRLDLSRFNSGIYIYRMIQNGLVIGSGRLVLER